MLSSLIIAEEYGLMLMKISQFQICVAYSTSEFKIMKLMKTIFLMACKIYLGSFSSGLSLYWQ